MEAVRRQPKYDWLEATVVFLIIALAIIAVFIFLLALPNP